MLMLLVGPGVRERGTLFFVRGCCSDARASRRKKRCSTWMDATLASILSCLPLAAWLLWWWCADQK